MLKGSIQRKSGKTQDTQQTRLKHLPTDKKHVRTSYLTSSPYAMHTSDIHGPVSSHISADTTRLKETRLMNDRARILPQRWPFSPSRYLTWMGSLEVCPSFRQKTMAERIDSTRLLRVSKLCRSVTFVSMAGSEQGDVHSRTFSSRASEFYLIHIHP